MAKNELDLQMEDYQYLPLRDVVFQISSAFRVPRSARRSVCWSWTAL